jgi:hypothetical protein
MDGEGRVLGFSISTDGMSLRDYFAAKSLQGLLSDGVGSLSDEELADWAYKLADAMLKAREE